MGLKSASFAQESSGTGGGARGGKGGRSANNINKHRRGEVVLDFCVKTQEGGPSAPSAWLLNKKK